MRGCFFICVSLFLLIGCNNKKEKLLGETAWQQKKNSEFKDASKSPLTVKDLKTFKGLSFFPFDSAYVITAKFTRTPESSWFDMKTTTNRISKERVFAIVEFKLNNKLCKLNVYQGQDNLNTEGLENYLFLPFLDKTNGEETYGGGRYIDLRIPEGNSIIIDFNKAYNPYCVYNSKFSCPIVPRENYLESKVKAGELNFKTL